MLQSKEFASEYLTEGQKKVQEEQNDGPTSPIKKYTEVMDDEVIRGSV